jgi:hypothetical protein
MTGVHEEYTISILPGVDKKQTENSLRYINIGIAHYDVEGIVLAF